MDRRKLVDGIKKYWEARGVPVGCLVGRAIYDRQDME
jgi:hypothetical protein